MISVNDIRPGTTVELDNNVWVVLEFLHVKPGKGAAFVRTKLRNLQTGSVQERTFRAGEKVGQARVERREWQYLYESGGEYTFMDTETYDQMNLTEEQIGEGKNFLLENMMCMISFYNGKSIGVELPNTVELLVTETDPGLRGDTATGGTKLAKLETGHSVAVPLFINIGDKLKIDTRSGAYISRA
ncbi:MAG: elongation factor P [Symbiobacteriia bacterium]